MQGLENSLQGGPIEKESEKRNSGEHPTGRISETSGQKLQRKARLELSGEGLELISPSQDPLQPPVKR